MIFVAMLVAKDKLNATNFDHHAAEIHMNAILYCINNSYLRQLEYDIEYYYSCHL